METGRQIREHITVKRESDGIDYCVWGGGGGRGIFQRTITVYGDAKMNQE